MRKSILCAIATAAVIACLALESQAKVLISELTYDAKKPYKSDDWVEICNYGTNSVDVSGWQLGDDKYDEGGTLYTLPAGTTLKPNGCLVIYSAAAFTSIYPGVTNAYGPSGIGFSKEDDAFVLLNEKGKVKCKIEYETEAIGGPWPNGSAYSNVLKFPYADYQEQFSSWTVSSSQGGSPGTLNPETSGLCVYKHSRNPNAPTTVTSPEIHFWACDNLAPGGAVASCKIAWSLTESGTYTKADMTLVEGQEYLYAFPPMAAGTTVFYYCEVTDAAGNTLKKYWNHEDLPYMYVVTDSPVYSGVVINEIMYNCLDTAYTNTKGNCKSYEFVELFNRTESSMDLSYWRFESNEKKFRLPAGTTLGAGKYLVLTDRQEAITTVYDYPAASGLLEFDLSLSNSSDTISLQNANGQEVDGLAYENKAPWPEKANGEGPSLELKNAFLDNSLPESWKASEKYGTPGKVNSVPEPVAAAFCALLLLALGRKK